MKLKFANFSDFLVVAIVMLLIYSSMLILMIGVFQDVKKDTLFISNYGFAILAAIATLSFTWAKSFDILDATQQRLIKNLNNAGSLSIIASLCFLASSFSKYVYINFDSFKNIIPIQSIQIVLKYMFIFGSFVLLNASFFYVIRVIRILCFTYLDSRKNIN